MPEVLLVDGDSASRAEIRALVGPAVLVVEVGTGEDALRFAATREFAAVLIALSLPGLDGLQTVAQLRKLDGARKTPVLFLASTPPDWLTVRRGYDLGALAYMVKPIDAQSLSAKLEVFFQLFRARVELKQREAEIQAANAALGEVTRANRAKDLYMGVLGHDLRNPLGAILMSARMMLMGGSLASSDRHSVNRIARNAERMAALIRDILDFTRGQAAGGIPIVPRSTDMGETCAAMVDEVSLLHPERTIEIQTHGSLQGQWDRERVEQVISNLLTNALTHGEGPIPTVPDGHRNHSVPVSVHNPGQPIAAAQLPELFEPFRRGTHSRVGLGLGLYIVKEILRAHGGSVEVVSTPEAGTTFTTRWPRVAAASRGREI